LLAIERKYQIKSAGFGQRRQGNESVTIWRTLSPRFRES
jgi:hypothetical protein